MCIRDRKTRNAPNIACDGVSKLPRPKANAPPISYSREDDIRCKETIWPSKPSISMVGANNASTEGSGPSSPDEQPTTNRQANPKRLQRLFICPPDLHRRNYVFVKHYSLPKPTCAQNTISQTHDDVANQHSGLGLQLRQGCSKSFPADLAMHPKVLSKRGNPVLLKHPHHRFHVGRNGSATVTHPAIKFLLEI